MGMDLIDALNLLEVKSKWERIAKGEALESDLVDADAQMWYMMEYVLKNKGKR